MKRIKILGTLAIAGLLTTLSSCNKDEESNALEPGTATISGKLRANLDETNIQMQNVPEGTGVTFIISGEDLDRNPNPNYDYEDVIVKATVDGNGEYSATLPAAKKNINVQAVFDDFEFDATILTTDDDGFQTAVTERRTFNRADANISIVDGQVLIRDYEYNLTGGDFQASATIRGIVEAQFIDNVGPVTGTNILDGGANYSNENGVAVLGGTGTGMTVNVTVNAVDEVINVAIANAGEGYTIGDVVTIDDGDGEAEIEITGVNPQVESVPEGVLLTFNANGNNYKVNTDSNGEYIVKLPAGTGGGTVNTSINGADFEQSSVFLDGGDYVTSNRIYEFAGTGNQNLQEGDIIELDLGYNRK